MEQTNLLKVLSFNMKRDGFGRHNRWMQRREIAADCIQESGATIVGVQEVLPKMRRDIETLLKNYSIVGCGRYEGRKSANDEHSVIRPSGCPNGLKNREAAGFWQCFPASAPWRRCL